MDMGVWTFSAATQCCSKDTLLKSVVTNYESYDMAQVRL